MRVYDTKTGNAFLLKLNKDGSVPKKYRSKRYDKGVVESHSGASKQYLRGWPVRS